jgi:hypothetical protein
MKHKIHIKSFWQRLFCFHNFIYNYYDMKDFPNEDKPKKLCLKCGAIKRQLIHYGYMEEFNEEI